MENNTPCRWQFACKRVRFDGRWLGSKRQVLIGMNLWWTELQAGRRCVPVIYFRCLLFYNSKSKETFTYIPTPIAFWDTTSQWSQALKARGEPVRQQWNSNIRWYQKIGHKVFRLQLHVGNQIDGSVCVVYFRWCAYIYPDWWNGSGRWGLRKKKFYLIVTLGFFVCQPAAAYPSVNVCVSCICSRDARSQQLNPHIKADFGPNP